MAYYDDLTTYTMGPAAGAATRAKEIAATMGQIAVNSLKSSNAARERDRDDFFANRLRAAQLPSVDACQSNIFTWLRVIENEAAVTRMPRAEVKPRPWLFNLKHRISHMFHNANVH
jgi:hypothetical protein